jgi:hypothetical protein
VIDVVIAEVKTNQPCTLNGPWTFDDRRNVHRVLAAIGCLPRELIADAAADIYQAGIHRSDLGLRIRLVAVGRDRSDDLTAHYPEATQLIWTDMLAFIWDRFNAYRHQKSDVHQWDPQGLRIKHLAGRSRDGAAFVADALPLMGVRNANTAG